MGACVVWDEVYYEDSVVFIVVGVITGPPHAQRVLIKSYASVKM